MYESTTTFVRKYESTFEGTFESTKVRESTLFRTKVRKYESTFESTFVLRKYVYFRTKVLSYIRKHIIAISVRVPYTKVPSKVNAS